MATTDLSRALPFLNDVTGLHLIPIPCVSCGSSWLSNNTGNRGESPGNSGADLHETT